MTWVLESLGNILVRSRKVLEFARQWCGRQFFWLQIDMFLQTKIAIIVDTRYVLCSADMPKMLSWPGLHLRPHRRSLQCSPRLLSCCLSLYLYIAGLWQGPGKMLLESWKSTRMFCKQDSENRAQTTHPCFITVWCSQVASLRSLHSTVALYGFWEL